MLCGIAAPKGDLDNKIVMNCKTTQVRMYCSNDATDCILFNLFFSLKHLRTVELFVITR